jgi:hypothetical protein
MQSCGKAEFGHMFRSFSLNSGAIRLKRANHLPQIGFPSLRSVKSDRLLAGDSNGFAVGAPMPEVSSEVPPEV